MQFLVELRSGASYQLEANYIEVVSGPRGSSYTLLGPSPGYPTAIIAVFPVELVTAILPLDQAGTLAPRRPPGRYADERAPAADGQPPAPDPGAAE